MIGNKSVVVGKVTIAQWERLFDVIGALPQLLISVITAPKEQRSAYAVVALQESLSDVTSIVSVLTGLEQDWIRNNASLDELVDYFIKVAKKNNFAEMLKNVQSVLSLTNLTKVQDAA